MLEVVVSNQFKRDLKRAVRRGRDISLLENIVNTLQYGDRIILLQQSDGWGEYIGSDDVDAVPGGWIETDNLLIGPAWLWTNEKTPLYEQNDTTASEIALLDESGIMPVLKDEGEWFMVSPGGGNAVGWIHDAMAERIELES